jgi:hypothetical protein
MVGGSVLLIATTLGEVGHETAHPERYERAAVRWIARLIAERPKIHLSEIELAAAGFREALHSERGVEALRGCR